MRSVWEIFWIAFVAGIIGTSAMTLMLFIMTKLEIVQVDMVRAVGSIFTKSLDSANSLGLLIHYIFGIFFAFLYTIIIVLLNIDTVFKSIVVGSTIGFIHGFVVSFLLVVAVAEHHPLIEFRQPGLKVAVGHYAAHITYGVIVGLVIGLMSF